MTVRTLFFAPKRMWFFLLPSSPELLDHQGEDLIVTDGKTLLGADDKAGIAEIVSAVVYLKEHPEIKHGKIRIGFNPDEEIGLAPISSM